VLLDEWDDSGPQGLCDLAFLRTVVDLWGDSLEDVSRLLEKKSAQVGMNVSILYFSTYFGLFGLQLQSTFNMNTSEHLARTQILLAALLPQSSMSSITENDQRATLLPFGNPASETQFQSAVEVVKPSARFGLLLVAGDPES
jgi:hypothetical protein